MDYQTLFRSRARWGFVPLSTLGIAGWLTAQTTVDLHNQARNVDFSNASATRVWKTGSTLPVQCNTGEGFFLLTAAPGQNLYLCTASGTWNQTSSPIAGTGSEVQSVSGTFVPGAVPSIDSTGTETPSGCTASGGQLTCSGGVNSGNGATRITGTEGSAPQAPPVGLQTLYLDSADHNFKSVDGNGTIRQYATTSGGETLSGKTLVNPSLGSTSLTMSVPNTASTGTVIDELAKLTGTASAAIVTSVADTGGAVGIVVSGAGTAGNVQIATSGQAICLFDGATVAGDYVTISNTVAGKCHDAGTAYPAGVQIVGRVLSSNAASGAFSVQLGPEVRGSSAAATGTSFNPLDNTTAWWRDEMTTNYQWLVNTDPGGAVFFGDPTFGDTQHPGVFQIQTGGTAGYSALIALAWPNGAEVMHYPTGASWEMDWVAKPWQISGATYSLGFSDSGLQNALFLSYNPSIGPDWLGVLKLAGVQTVVDLGVAASTSTWAKLRMRSDATAVYFSVNGSPERTICPAGCTVTGASDLGAREIQPFAQVVTQSASQQVLAVDFFALQITGLSR